MLRTVNIGRYVLYADDRFLTGLKVLQNGMNYERHVHAELSRTLPTASTFIDIGANVGVHSLAAKVINPKCHVFAFEASIHNVRLMCRTVHANKIEGITIVHAALSSSACVMWTNGCQDNMACDLTIDPDRSIDDAIPALPLDMFDIPQAQVIKMDIEGMEYAAWQGMQKQLSGHPTLIFEFCPEVIGRSGVSPVDQLRWIMGKGYSIYVLDDERPGVKRRVDSAEWCMSMMESEKRWILDLVAEPIG